MSSKKRLGRAMQLCHVWSHSRWFLPIPADTPPPPEKHGSRPWRRDVGTIVWDCVGGGGRSTKTKQKKKRGGRVIKQKGRGSHTLGNGVSDDRTFLGDICEESKRIIFLFPPLQRYLLWHIAVLCYRKSVDIWSCIFLWVGSVIGSSETNLWRWLMLALVASVLFRQNSNAVPISTLKVRI